MGFRVTVALLAALAASTAVAGDKHMGVATCASGACHGAARLSGGKVRQDEYLVWQRQDQHAQAFATLRTERSRRIAANLGLGDPTTAAECLTCHADAVPAADRGERHQITDGVGCETCHGPAERWLQPHVRGFADHKARLASGLYPTWDPKARAELCLSCHQGSGAARPMTHAIMGAGHPPLLFEMDTFTALQPPHFDPDADYQQRKGKPDDAHLWILGQAVAARELLAGIAGPALAPGLFPELAFFDCNACHHSLINPRWEPGQGTGLRPGRARIADASLYFTSLWLETVKPELAARFREEVRGLHEASTSTPAALKDHAESARRLVESDVLPLANDHAHTQAELRKLALQLADLGAGPRAGDFTIAEQNAMATAVFATALGEASGRKPGKPVQDAIDAVYAAVENRDRYEPDKMRRALRQVRDEIAKAYPAK